MTVAYGQVTIGCWAPPATPPPGDADVPRERCRSLIAEALIIRERMSLRIDASTYQERMNDLVSRGRGGADHVER